MKPFNVMFEEQKSEEIICDGRVIKRRIVYKDCSTLHFEFSEIITNSKYTQAIVLLFSEDFTGEVFINDVKFDLPKGAFRKINIWEDTAPPVIDVKIYFASGFVSLCNGADPLGTKQICKMLTDSSSMTVESLGEHEYKVNCNDFENDSDFDDLVFKMRVWENE